MLNAAAVGTAVAGVTRAAEAVAEVAREDRLADSPVAVTWAGPHEDSPVAAEDRFEDTPGVTSGADIMAGAVTMEAATMEGPACTLG
jgi:hypothetical protein